MISAFQFNGIMFRERQQAFNPKLMFSTRFTNSLERGSLFGIQKWMVFLLHVLAQYSLNDWLAIANVCMNMRMTIYGVANLSDTHCRPTWLGNVIRKRVSRDVNWYGDNDDRWMRMTNPQTISKYHFLNFLRVCFSITIIIVDNARWGLCLPKPHEVYISLPP